MINQISKDIFLNSLRKKNNCILMKNENKFKELLKEYELFLFFR